MHTRGTIPAFLTQRGVEVLNLVAADYENREIAATLGSALDTVKNHLHMINLRLGTATRTGAVVRAYQLGFIVLPKLEGSAQK